MKSSIRRDVALTLEWLLALLIIAGCSEAPVDAGTNQVPKPSKIAIVSGNNQQGKAAQTLGSPVVVLLADKEGKPVEGAKVSFRILSGGGVVSDTIAGANSQGHASAVWTLGTGPEYILKATLVDAAPAAQAVYLYANSNLEIKTSWTSNIDFKLGTRVIPHDNRILESNNFLTFSDASSDDVKIIFSKMAEESFAEIKQSFGIQGNEELRMFKSKMTIFTNKSLNIDQSAFAYGFFLYGQDSEVSIYIGNDDFRYRREVKHETMHAFQWVFGLTGTRGYGKPPTWFAEGIAEYISGGYFTPITTTDQLKEWIEGEGHSNPIYIRDPVEYPVPYEQTWEYYSIFNLAVRYLLDKQGHGRTFHDVRAMYADMLVSGNFNSSFERTMGMSVSYYGEHFFELMNTFIQKVNNAQAATAIRHSPSLSTLPHPDAR